MYQAGLVGMVVVAAVVEVIAVEAAGKKVAVVEVVADLRKFFFIIKSAIVENRKKLPCDWKSILLQGT